MSKVIDARAGDRWTRFDKNVIVLYRDGKDCAVTKDEIGAWSSALRTTQETDLPTSEAHAQLRAWGYEVRGDVEPALTESRVREIVAEMLAAKVKPTAAPDDWRARCRVWQPTPDNLRWWAVHSPSGEYALSKLICDWRKMSVGYNDYGRNFESEAQARSALAKAPIPPDVIEVGDGVPYGGKTYRVVESSKAPPPPDVSPDPDWRGLLAAVVHARSHTEHDNAMAEAAKALSSARTNLAAKGGK
ncbi:MAG: hypothetical protein KGR25_11450 [Chloroflexi bacterium]|nr:hypothetical protein [Chloroflexota bacterium]